jgi:hypothetical protein
MSWKSLALGASPLIIGIILRYILDLKLYPPSVKYLSRAKKLDRFLFRERYPEISGSWIQEWDISHERKKDQKYTSEASIYRFGPYVYAEFSHKDIIYSVSGRIQNAHIIGIWYDKNDDWGYLGTFQLMVTDPSILKGRWIGHSKSRPKIRSGQWNWNRK